MSGKLSAASPLIDTLFMLHGCCALVSGAAAYSCPQFYHHFMNEKHLNSESMPLVDDVVALYGALILGQGFITLFALHHKASSELKAALGWAYVLVFGLTTAKCMISHYRESQDWNDYNIANMVLFGFLFISYFVCAFDLTFLQMPTMHIKIGQQHHSSSKQP